LGRTGVLYLTIAARREVEKLALPRGRSEVGEILIDISCGDVRRILGEKVINFGGRSQRQPFHYVWALKVA
jgi:hypothetical protein